jgi:hypothetical protein
VVLPGNNSCRREWPFVPPTRRLKRKIGEGHQHALKAINLAIKDRNGLVLGAAQGLRNELRQNPIRVVLEKLTPIKVKHLARHSLQDEPLWEDVMADALHIVCPHCDASNRMPRERLRDGAKCGSCHRAAAAIA